MSRWQRRFAVLVLIELAAALGAVAYLATRARIPAVDLSQVDVETAGVIAEHQRWMNLSSSDHWQGLAQLYLAFGYLPQAEPCARQAAELDPSSKDAAYVLAVTLDRLGRLAEAEEKLKHAMALGVVESAASVRLGRIALRREAAGEAEQAFRAALKKNPDETLAAIGLGRVLLHTHRAAEVASMMAHFVEKEPESHAPCQLMALAELEQGRPDAAESWLLKAEWRPSYSRFTDPLADVERWAASCGALRWATQAHAAAAAGEDGPAAFLIQHALTLGWDEKFALELAVAFVKLEQPQDALAMLRQVTTTAGRSDYTSFLRGEAYRQLGKTNSAVDAWSESVRFRSNQAAHRRLAETYRRQPEAEREQVALALGASGLLACQQGKPEETAALLAESLRLKPDQSTAWYFMGEAQRVLGQNVPAREAYGRCLSINPDHGRALEALRALDAAASEETAGEPR